MSGSSSNPDNGGGVEWAPESEARPGGAPQQQKTGEAAGNGPLIRIKVFQGPFQHDVSVPPESTFGELKKLLMRKIELEPEDQRLFFRGKQKRDDEYLHMSGVKDGAKLLLLEDPGSKERKLEKIKKDQGVARACEAITKISTEVDKLAAMVSGLDSSVQAGMKVAEKEFIVLTELLMVQLLKLDGIEAEGEAKVQRRSEVRRIQRFVEALDSMKEKNSNLFNNGRL